MQRIFARLRASNLCRRNVPLTSAWETIDWWESRRIPFNLIVGSAGILSCIVVGVVALGSEVLFKSDFGGPDPPIFVLIEILLYAIMANLCFTGGWLAELVVRRFWPRESDRFATSSFSSGLVLSVLLTLAPGMLVGAAGVFELLRRGLDFIHRRGH